VDLIESESCSGCRCWGFGRVVKGDDVWRAVVVSMKLEISMP
jgi:hypothetical protein